MPDTKNEINLHPTEVELADYLNRSLSAGEKSRLEGHIAGCGECLDKIVSAYESVNRKALPMNKINIYIVLAVLSFIASFMIPRYFIQFLVATLLLGIKWIVDSKSTKMLVMIYDAWKKGGEREAGRIIETLNSRFKNRL